MKFMTSRETQEYEVLLYDNDAILPRGYENTKNLRADYTVKA